MKTSKNAILYIGDNGRLTCGAIGCAGATAHASGMRRDLSGAPIEKLDAASIDELTAMLGEAPRCESCGVSAACPGCDGRGRLDNPGDYLGTETCPACAGSGRGAA